LVFVDETGLNTSMTRLYSRAKAGSRAFGTVPKGHHKNLTVVGAIALDGVRTLMAYEGGTTKHAFLEFVKRGLTPTLQRGDVVVMDNLRAHYADGVQQSIEAVGASVLYLPPYSPELNPIERTWSKMKTFFRKTAARTLDDLVRAMPRIRDTIQLTDLAGWFRLSGYQNHCK
jgi:transposase